MKQREPMLNTFNPVMPYLLRCNSDSTSLSVWNSDKIHNILCD